MIYKHDNKIIIDTREQQLLEFDGWEAGTLRQCLKTGDYSLEGFKNLIAVERKSLPDLLSCLGKNRKRFYEQMDRLQEFKYKYLLLETTASTIRKGLWRWPENIKPPHVIGYLNSITVKRGIGVLYYSEPDTASIFLMNLFDKIIKAEKIKS